MSTTHTHGHALDHHDDHGPAKGFKRWLTTTNHKDIGTMYLIFSLVMFLVGGAMALVVRAELFMPGMQLVDPQFFNTMTTVHALIMVFGAVMPATVGLANWMIPLQIGAPAACRAAFCFSSQVSNSAWGSTSTTTGMKPWSRPQSSAHWPR
jgi:cytochrome c oxidase subunit 1